MNSRTNGLRSVQRVLILADASADWKVAGLRQLDRLVLSLNEFKREVRRPLSVAIFWSPDTAPERRRLPNESRLSGVSINEFVPEASGEDERFDLIVSTRLFVYRDSIAELVDALPQSAVGEFAPRQDWQGYRRIFEDALSLANDIERSQRWRYLRDTDDIPSCERAFLRQSGKSQDGLVSRHLNRPLSRTVTRLLLKLPITPNAWSVLVFVLPLVAAFQLLHGTTRGFLIGCAVYQLYSILDGCDGEISRAKFLQTEFGRRLDSLLDLVGNILLALCLGVGLAKQWQHAHASGWFYVAEGITAALCIVLSEGIVFTRRSRANNQTASTKWNGALYQRHHEFLERSGILFLGEKFAWWLVQLTKRDMAMLAFLFLASIGFAEGILHLLLLVSGTSALLAGNAFLRQPAAAIPQEAS